MLCTQQHRLADEFGWIQQAQCHAGIPAFWCASEASPAPIAVRRPGEMPHAGTETEGGEASPAHQEGTP